jgi:hypothetical protein
MANKMGTLGARKRSSRVSEEQAEMDDDRAYRWKFLILTPRFIEGIEEPKSFFPNRLNVFGPAAGRRHLSVHAHLAAGCVWFEQPAGVAGRNR